MEWPYELCRKKRITLKELAKYPLVSFEPSFTAGRQIIKVFQDQGIAVNPVVIAIGADIMKACVEEGLGIAIISELGFDPRRDADLQALPVGHLFKPSIPNVLLSRDRYVRRYTYDFIELCEPRWTRSNVQKAMGKVRSRKPVSG